MSESLACPKFEKVKNLDEAQDFDNTIPVEIKSPEKQFLEKIEAQIDEHSLDTLMDASKDQDTVSEKFSVKDNSQEDNLSAIKPYIPNSSDNDSDVGIIKLQKSEKPKEKVNTFDMV